MSDIDKFHEWVETQSPLALREYMFAQAAWQARCEEIKQLNQEKDSEVVDLMNVIQKLTAKLDKAKEALKWIDKVNAMDSEYVRVARQALEELNK